MLHQQPARVGYFHERIDKFDQAPKFQFDRNVYWDASGRPITFAGATLDAWRMRGMDEHAIVADPLFADADHGDFTLRPGSPALAIGFEPLDLRDVGPRR